MAQYIIKRRFSTLKGVQLVNINGKMQRIRYSPGEDTIIAKEQSEYAKPKMIFVQNQMIFADDELLIDFLDTWSKDPKVNWIEKYDPQKYAKKSNLKFEQKGKAYAYIVSGEIATTGVVAYMLGGRNLVYKPNGETKSIDVIKQGLYPLAESRPGDVIKAYEQSDDKKMEFLVSKAFMDDILSYSPSSNKVVFQQSNQTLLKLKPNMGTDVEQVAAYLKTQEGKSDLADIKNYFSSNSTTNDFTDIDGIGAATAKRLREAGFRTFDDVKLLSLEDFTEKLKDAGIKFTGKSYEEIYNEIVK